MRCHWNTVRAEIPLAGRKKGQVLPFAFLYYYLLVQTFGGNLSSVSRGVKHFEKRDAQCRNVRPGPLTRPLEGILSISTTGHHSFAFLLVRYQNVRAGSIE